MAGVSETCALVAVERGGYAYHVNLYYFERRDGTWQGGFVERMVEIPRSLGQMREVIYSPRGGTG